MGPRGLQRHPLSLRTDCAGGPHPSGEGPTRAGIPVPERPPRGDRPPRCSVRTIGRESARSPSARGRRVEDLEGERSPWEERARGTCNTVSRATDSTTEQSLGAASTFVGREHACAWKRAGAGRRSEKVGNGRRATATVTWCGCRRGDSSEGCEPRCGDGRPAPEPLQATGVARADGDARNAANPRIGSGMQQARDSPSGETRRGGAKPRGRNAIRGWLPRTEADRPFIRTALSVGVDAREHVDGGGTNGACNASCGRRRFPTRPRAPRDSGHGRRGFGSTRETGWIELHPRAAGELPLGAQGQEGPGPDREVGDRGAPGSPRGPRRRRRRSRRERRRPLIRYG